MKYSRRKELKIVLALTAVVCLALVLLGSATTAWYYQNKQMDSLNQQIQLDDSGLFIGKYRVYRYSEDSNRHVLYDSVDDVTNIDTSVYEMTPYDSIFTRRNINAPLLFVIELCNVPTGQESVAITLGCSEGYYDNLDKRFTSNIVHVAAAAEKDIKEVGFDYDDENSIDEMFNTVVNYFKEEDYHTFVNPTNNEKNSNLVFTFNTKDKINDGNVRLFLMVDYDVPLIKKQTNIEYFSDVDILQNGIVKFENDITDIAFKLPVE